MLSAHLLENFIDEHSQIGRKVIQERAAWLRSLGLIPRGGRGLHAQTMNATEAAWLLFACCIERSRLTDDVKPLRAYFTLYSAEGGPRVFFGPILAQMMWAPLPFWPLQSSAGGIREVRLLKDWPRASVIYLNNSPQTDFLPDKFTADGDSIHQELVLPIGFLRKLGAALNEKCTTGAAEQTDGAAVA
jgi:hypothetical protein